MHVKAIKWPSPVLDFQLIEHHTMWWVLPDGRQWRSNIAGAYCCSM